MSSKDKLKELLNYSTSLSGSNEGESSGITPGRKLDASMLDEIMGPDDAKLMVSSMEAIETRRLDTEQVEIAFENLEALVEQIDNAKNLQNLRLWSPLLRQLQKSTIYKVGACAVIATALQNNPVSQSDFLTYDGGLQCLLDLVVDRDEELTVRRKALFATTSLLRNCPAAQTKFEDIGGWAGFSALLDAVPADLNMLRRIVFFLGTLYAGSNTTTTTTVQDEQRDSVSTSVKTGFPPKLVTLLARADVQDDEDLSEKVLYTLAQAIKYDRDVLNKDLKNKLKVLASIIKQRYGEEFYEGGELDGLL